MQKQWTAGDSAKEAYDAWAPVYDEFNQGYMYERWTARLLEKAEEAGVGGSRLLDIACGTGLSFIPMLDRGWTVTGCDISPGMLDLAREKAGERAELLEADMRELPDLGEFDLIWAVNDPLNYLLDVEELEATFEGMRRNLARDGIALFDVNTLTMYRTFFSKEVVVEGEGGRLVWQGQLRPRTSRRAHSPKPGSRPRATRTSLPCIVSGTSPRPRCSPRSTRPVSSASRSSARRTES